jgi:hypothetical protein
VLLTDHGPKHDRVLSVRRCTWDVTEVVSFVNGLLFEQPVDMGDLHWIPFCRSMSSTPL